MFTSTFMKVNLGDWNNFVKECNEIILNLYCEYNEEKNFVCYFNNQVYGLLKYFEEHHIGTIIFWIKDWSNQEMIENIINYINEILENKIAYFKLNIQVFDFQTKYIDFLTKLGFKIELYLKEHIRIDEKYYSVVCMCKDNSHKFLQNI